MLCGNIILINLARYTSLLALLITVVNFMYIDIQVHCMYRCTDIPLQDGVHPPDLTVINYRV